MEAGINTRFAARQGNRLFTGAAFGALMGIVLHLLFRDSRFQPAVTQWWSGLGFQHVFEGFKAYADELFVLCGAVLLAIVVLAVGMITRYSRAWWAGITSITAATIAVATIFLLQSPHRSVKDLSIAVCVVIVIIGIEYWRQHVPVSAGRIPIPKIRQNAAAALDLHSWQALSSDDPINDWSQDLVGRAGVVELLAEHVIGLRTPIIALQGGLGDGKSSVLNLLRRTLAGRAIVVSFSAWLPGSEASLAIDLFRDIATECRKFVYVPQLRKRTLAYARIISGSVAHLAGLKDMLPTESQKDEIEDLRNTLARVPKPIVVLLDEIDRMQKEELLVLFKILRGAPSMPNVTFVCAFSAAEMRRELNRPSEISVEYFEKFFPVTISLATPDPDMIGRLFQAKIKTRFDMPEWFVDAREQKAFPELLERLWQTCISRVCTNFRKSSLLFNDVSAAARLVEREVNVIDLIGIECLKRFYPTVHELVRRNAIFLAYEESEWTPNQYMYAEDRKKKDAASFFASLEETIGRCSEPDTAKGLLSCMFPAYDSSTRHTLFSFGRRTDRDSAWHEKRICNADYFPIYFRAAVPEQMFSNAELAQVLNRFNEARTEELVTTAFKELLFNNPRGQPRRNDALWKVSRSVDKLKDQAAEWVAYASAACAADYRYDVMNVGEAARALNIVFEVTQRFSKTSSAQNVLIGAMDRASDDTFAFRLLEFTRNKERNQVLTNFSNVDAERVKAEFIDRMRSRYGPLRPIEEVNIALADRNAFRIWVENSDGDRALEQGFWRRYIGHSRKALARAINFIYPEGVWSSDPRPIIEPFLPTEEIRRLLLEPNADEGEQLDEVEVAAIERFQALQQGRWNTIPGGAVD